MPLSENWAMRFSTLRQHRDNYADNYADPAFTTRRSELEGYIEPAERLQLLYTPDATLKVPFNVHRRTTTGSARLFRANLIKKCTNDFVDGFDPNKIVTNGQNFQNLKTSGANVRVSWDLGAVMLFSITGFEQVNRYLSRGDIDGGTPAGPGFIPFQVETAGGITGVKQYGQEFRAESKIAGPLNWQAGVYYFNEDANGFSDNFNSTTGATPTLIA